jgi:hypothetical protein|tara:strand:- start:399 stop:1094 length:696 start_codon:yes stop_codon:yes gene_type:complete
METKILINSLLLILIFYILIDCIPHRYVFGTKKTPHQYVNRQENFNNKIGDNEFGGDNIEIKDNINELYDYMDNKFDRMSTDILDSNDVKPDNYFTNDNNTPNFNTGGVNTSRFYDMNMDGVMPDKLEKSNYVSPGDKKETETVMIDKQSKNSSIIDDVTNKEKVFKPDTWQYKNELPMNGGAFNGLTGFDSQGGSYAIYSQTELNLEQCNSETKCTKVDDLRNGMMQDRD